MGIRSMNMIVLKPGIALTEAVMKYLNEDTADVISGDEGTLIVYESNFTPLHARDGKGEHCTFDLEEEIAVQRFLGSLPLDSFHMIRAGDDCDTRGRWLDHSFVGHPLVADIIADYKRIMDDAEAA